MKKIKYIFGGLLFVFLIVVLAFTINTILNEKDQKEAIKQTEIYLAENYPNIDYKILNIYSNTDYGHYGYFKHAVTVENTETKETFDVYYDKNMSRMEDSIKLKKIDTYLDQIIKPQIEQYVEEHFGETKYISVDYHMETGKPMILVKFKEEHKDISQRDFDAFITYIQQTIGLDHANVIVDYWSRPLSFNKDY